MLYKNKDDETLVNLTLLGEQDAYEELVERWKKAVLSSAMFVLNDSYLAEDAAQDAFITAWTKLDKLQNPSRFGVWVRRIARNRAINIKKRDGRLVDYGFEYSEDRADTYAMDRAVYENWCKTGGDEYGVGQNEVLEGSIERLPKKVRAVIRLYYIEGHSIAEIAHMLGCTTGTVKRHLHDGREKIRKDYENMTVNETFVKEVMERVEKLKRFWLLNSKDGFKEECDGVKADLEKLPENEERLYAEAEILDMGWWFGAEKKSDELLALIKDRAERGRNESVMLNVMCTEQDKLSGQAKIDLIKEVHIPYLEKIGFKYTLNCVKLWLGCEYALSGRSDEAEAEFNYVINANFRDDCHYALAKSALECMELEKKHSQAVNTEYSVTAEEWKKTDGKLYMVSEPGYYSGSWSGEIILGYYAGLCDRTIYDENLPLGGVTVGSDGSKQIHAEDGVSVETPMGIIEGCEKWTCNNKKENSEIYFKKGLGIVKLKTSRIKNPFILESCNIVGGEGAIPTAVGNTWKYVSLGNTEFKEESMDVEITYSHDSKVIVKYTSFLIKHKCDENNFNEMINFVADRYMDKEKNDLTPESKAIAYEYLAKAEKVACTELQKAHYSAAKNVIDRIFMEPDIKPDQTEKGICNFLAINRAVKTDGSINLVDVTFDESGERLVFGRKEWKNGYPMGVQCNFNYDLIQDILDCVWDDKWVDGYETVVKHDLWNCRLASPVKVTAVPSLTVAGEEYKNCLCVAFECKEQENSEKIDYDLLLGPKEYYYAPVVGIVRMVHHSPDGKTTTYDLTSYSGTGEGYFPMVAGMVRHYDAVDLDRNYRAYSEYTFAEDEDGSVKIYGDLCGMKKVKPEEK